MTTYTYRGPIASITLRDAEEIREVILFPEREINLPEQNSYVQTLAAKGFLSPAASKKEK